MSSKNIFDKDLFPNCHKGHQYALDVMADKIPANIYVKGACLRYLKDINREDLVFETSKAERFMRLFQKFEHVIGEWDNKNIILEPWQCFFYLNVEGFYWKHNGKRKYKTAHLEVARGNGKSAVSSVTGLIYLRLIDTVKGNKVYAAATKKEQAKIVLDSARAMAKANKSYLKKNGVRVFAHHIAHEKSESEFRALSSDKDSLDGLQPVLGIIDELHAHKDRGLYDVVDSAMSKRKDSLLLIITTAGFNTDGIGYSQSCYAKKVAIGKIDDESFFALCYCLDEGDDWREEKNWIKANPNLGVSVDLDSLRSKCFKAIENPQDEVNFLVKHLNMWQNALVQYFPMKKWAKGNIGPEKMAEITRGRKCYASTDLASKIDLAGLGFCYKIDGKFYVKTEAYCPKDQVESSKNVNYKTWAKEGYFNVTEGAEINYERIQDDLVGYSKKSKIEDCHYDSWNATEFAQRMSKKRISMVDFRMSTANLSEPMKRLQSAIKEGKVYHDGCPVLEWCMANVVAKHDHNDNVFPRKEHPDMKIDLAICLIMAIAGWINEEESASVYEDRGVRIL